MNISDYKKLSDLITENGKFIVLAHENPDGDAIGSVLGTVSFLRTNGKEADAIFPQPLPDKYKFLLDNEMKLGTIIEPSRYDLVLCLDSASSERVAVPENANLKLATLVNIDHHPDNKLYGKYNFVDSSAAATAQLLFKTFKMLKNAVMPPRVAEALLVGLIMDTGGFRFDNTDARTVKTAAELISLGADCPALMNKLFFSKPLAYVKFEAEMLLNHLRTEFDGRYAWLVMDDNILAKYRLGKKDTEDLIDSIKSLQGVQVAAVLYKSEKGVKFSLRSKNKKISVAKIAREIGGGGHEMAAGGLVKSESLDGAGRILSQKVAELLK